MWTRCTNCNKAFDFRNKRGAKLSNCKCQCGGSFEMLSHFRGEIKGPHPTNPDYTFTRDGEEYHYGLVNKAGELFVLDIQKRILIPSNLTHDTTK